MARSDTKTYLSLDRWAEIMGLNPVAFNQASMGGRCYASCGNHCPETWFQYAWQAQHGFLSREELAWVIQDAERDIQNFLGVPLCPEIRCKVLPYNGYCQPPSAALHGVLEGPWWPRSDSLPWQPGTRWGKPLAPSYEIGRPAWFLPRLAKETLCVPCFEDGSMELLNQAGTAYDPDGSECPILVEITCELEAYEPGEVQPCQIRLYYANRGQEETWRIHRPKSVKIEYDEGLEADVLTIQIESWKLIEPSLWEKLEAPPPNYDNANDQFLINLLDPDSFAECIEVVRVYHDPSLPLVEFCREPRGICGCQQDNCSVCNVSCQPGCVAENTRVPGFVLAYPAHWDEEKQSWCGDSAISCGGGAPDFVRFYYWTGYLPSSQCPPQSLCEVGCAALERTIAILAASRLSKNVCSCSCNKTHWWMELQTNTSHSTRESGTYFNTKEMLDNPFGVRLGEIEAYRRLLLIKQELHGLITSTSV